MYNPAHFTEARPDALHRIIRTHPLGVLVSMGPHGLDANHLPFHLDPSPGPDRPHGTLLAHVARANPLWREVASGSAVMVVFRGAQGYITPNSYPSKHATHRAVPTWNYEAVHVHGTLWVHDDEKFTRSVVARLTHTHESAVAAASHPTSGMRPWKMGDAPRDYLDAMLQAIVGIELRITRLEGKRKLSQNREARDLDGAIDSLLQRGHTDLAQAMAQARPTP